MDSFDINHENVVIFNNQFLDISLLLFSISFAHCNFILYKYVTMVM